MFSEGSCDTELMAAGNSERHINKIEIRKYIKTENIYFKLY